MKESIIKVLKLMIPFVPHVNLQSLELFKCKSKLTYGQKLKDMLHEVKLADSNKW